jgi:hypothetical protein
MTNIYKLFQELNKELKSRDITSELFTYETDTNNEYVEYFGSLVLHNHTFNDRDELQMLENIKFNLEYMLFNIQTALYAVEAVKKKEDNDKLARVIFGDEKIDKMSKED